MRRIVYTRHDGGVDVCTPTQWAFDWLSCGGFWGNKPRGWYDRQIESQINRGVRPDAARRYVRAMISGGCTTAEAYEIIRDRDCAHLGTAHELWDFEDLPDRWFRNAWTRSHNGGPIEIDLEKARPIQWQRIHSSLLEQNAKRFQDMLEPIEIPQTSIRQKIKSAQSLEELRSIWPLGVAR